MNPVIKFTTLFGLLAVELAVQLTARQGARRHAMLLAALFFGASLVFVWRSFYGMRIKLEAAQRERCRCAASAANRPFCVLTLAEPGHMIRGFSLNGRVVSATVGRRHSPLDRCSGSHVIAVR